MKEGYIKALERLLDFVRVVVDPVPTVCRGS